MGKLILKFTWEGRTKAKSALEKKNKIEKIIAYNFKNYYKVTVIKIMWYKG